MGSVLGVEFRKDALHMALDGVLADGQLIRDQLVSIAGRNERENLDFARGQRVIGGMRRKLRGHFRMDTFYSGVDCTNRLQQILPDMVLQNIGFGPRFQSALRECIATIGCQNDDSCVAEFAPDGEDGIDPIHVRHLQVHESDIRMVRTELRTASLPVEACATNFMAVWFARSAAIPSRRSGWSSTARIRIGSGASPIISSKVAYQRPKS